jgi:hypothetical protein
MISLNVTVLNRKMRDRGWLHSSLFSLFEELYSFYCCYVLEACFD